MKNKGLILFDLDGVLLDSKQNMAIAWKAVRQKHNINIDFSDYFSNIGRPFADILNLLEIYDDQQAVENTFNTVSTQHLDEVRFFPSVKVVLTQIIQQQIKIGIVTSKNDAKTQKVLNMLDITFDIVQTPNDQLNGKPAPDHLLYAMQTLNINPENTFYIGDMDVDYQTAKAANVDYAHATWGYGYCDDENVVHLSDITHLLSIIK